MTAGAQIGRVEYDGLGRRVTKQITNCGDWDGTDRFLWDGWRMVENRQYDFGAGQWRLFEQYVWGLQYIDELVHIALNQDVQDPNEDACERRLWVCQDANYNVTAMFGNGNRTVERYEYTPYGQRTVYSQGWLMGDCDDNGTVNGDDYYYIDFELGNTDTTGLRGDTDGNGLVNTDDYYYIEFYLDASLPDDAWYPRLHSTAGPRNPNAPQFHQLSRDKEACPFGHQGLFEDREWGDLHVRTRNLPWMFMRWPTRDGSGYPDGPDFYSCVQGNPLSYTDPTGQFATPEHIEITRDAWAATGLAFRPAGLLTHDYLTEMINNNWNTDIYHPLEPAYHAQDIAFVGLIKARMDAIKGRRCWENWAWISGDWATLNDIGTALHILQDVYAHTDWVDGTDMDPVYKAYGDALRGKNKPNTGTVSLTELEKGKNGEFVNTVFYTGGFKADDPHDRYAADSKTQGRARDNNAKAGIYGLGQKAYTAAKNAATMTSKEFIIWAKTNMQKCCHDILFR